MDPFSMLELLLSENQFELILPKPALLPRHDPPGLPDE